MIRFAVEDPETGNYVNVHNIKYSGSYDAPSLANPNLQLCAAAINTTNNTDMVVNVGSMGGFIEGRINGAHFHNGAENSTTLTANVEKPLITIHNKKIYNGKMNKVRIKLIFSSVATDGTKGVIFRYKFNPALTGANFVEIEPDVSIVETDTSATLISGGDEQFTIAKSRVDSEVIDLAGSSFYLNPGDFITVSAISTGASDVVASFNWEELF